MNWRDGFERYTAISGTPAMTVTRHGISFNQAAVLKLQRAPYVRLYLDRGRARFAIEACGHDEDGTLFFYRGAPTSKGVRWNNADLRATFERLMGWNLEYEGYKVAGVYHDDGDPALEFSLAEASPMPERSTRPT